MLLELILTLPVDAREASGSASPSQSIPTTIFWRAMGISSSFRLVCWRPRSLDVTAERPGNAGRKFAQESATPVNRAEPGLHLKTDAAGHMGTGRWNQAWRGGDAVSQVGRARARRRRDVHDRARRLDRQHRLALDRADVSRAGRWGRRVGDHRLPRGDRRDAPDVRTPFGSRRTQARLDDRSRHLHAGLGAVRSRELSAHARRRPGLPGTGRTAYLLFRLGHHLPRLPASRTMTR